MSDLNIDLLDVRIGETGGIVVTTFDIGVQALLAEEVRSFGVPEDLDIVSPPVLGGGSPDWSRAWSVAYRIAGTKIWFGMEEVDGSEVLVFASLHFLRSKGGVLMAVQGTAWVKDGYLVTEIGERIALDTPAWFAWLETATLFLFCYNPRRNDYRLTARKDPYRSQWNGSNSYESKLPKVYLGLSERPTMAHLEQACDQLAHQVQFPRR